MGGDVAARKMDSSCRYFTGMYMAATAVQPIAAFISTRTCALPLLSRNCDCWPHRPSQLIACPDASRMHGMRTPRPAVGAN